MIPVNRPIMGAEEDLAVRSTMVVNMLTSAAHEGGHHVRKFEHDLAKFCGSKHAIAVSSGTAALHCALLAAQIKPGSEVLLPSFTFAATANAVMAVGAKPVFVDVNRYRSTMDPDDLEKKITKKSSAVIPVHLYGEPCEMEEIMDIARGRGLTVIEDACQSLGSRYRKKQTGRFGEMGCFSFYAGKVMTTGEGGAIITDDDELAKKLRMARNHGMVEGYDTQFMGLNYRMTEMAAAIGIEQLKKLPGFLAKRQLNAELLTDLLVHLDLDIALPSPRPYESFNWYLYTARFPVSKRGVVQKALNDSGFGAAVYYYRPAHMTTFYAKMRVKLPRTEDTASSVLSLPVHPKVSSHHLEEMVTIIKNNL